MTKSNKKGRAFEYIVTKELEDHIKSKGIKYFLSQRAIKDNKRDIIHLNELSTEIQKILSQDAKKFISWTIEKEWLNNIKEISIDRLPDSEGVKGDVTDLVIKLIDTEGGVDIKNISLKHNHEALKHPRISRLPQQCGIEDKGLIKNYLIARDNIWDNFFREAKKINSDFTTFKELKDLDKEFINLNLYKPLIELVISFLEQNVNNSDNTFSFFKFITGKRDFYQVKAMKDKVQIVFFKDISVPKSFKIQYPYKDKLNTFLMTFNNDWKITFRLHTASSSFIKKGKINKSTKFDVNCINIDSLLKIEEVN
ncbi:MAG: HaeIII family restriction endonuclease [Nanoarchaeota archaeon]|nr:HaeIII family restriction endonuclease [Nanoarchaeota archaeon]